MALRTDGKLVLASSSASRKMLLERAGLRFEVAVSGVDESVPENFTPDQVVECLARRKGEAVLPLCPRSAIIASDSVVSIDGIILGKPKDDEDARNMLKRLSGRTHEVFTGVCLLAGGREDVFHQATKVTFYSLSDDEIAEYVSLGESEGRAGSYTIEGRGVMLAKTIEGDYCNIVGLPVGETLRRLRNMIGPLPWA